MKRAIAFVAAAVMAVSLTGCSKDGVSNAIDEVSQFVEADGRDYGNTKTAEIGETLKNSFFTMKVNSVYSTDSYNEFYLDEGSTSEIVVVNVTAENIFGEVINVGTYDYVLRYGEGEDDYCDSTDEIAVGLDTAYPDSMDIEDGESVTGDIFFVVPADATDLKLEYLEVYDDDFEGSTYQINLGDPDKQQANI